MASPSDHTRNSHSFVYRLYRRLRYMLYLKKQKRRIRKEERSVEKAQKLELKARLKAQYLSDKKAMKVKAREEQRKINLENRERRKEIRNSSRYARKESRYRKNKIRKKIRAERRLRKRKKRKLFRYYLIIRHRQLKRAVCEFSLQDGIMAVRRVYKNRSLYRNNSVIFVNSTVYFIVSYLSLYFFSQIVTILAGLFYNYPSVWFYNDVYFDIAPERWYADSVKTVYAAGPLLTLVTGIIFLALYQRVRESASTFKMFFLWGFLHSLTMFFGALLSGTLFVKGIGHVLAWMYISDPGKVFYSIASISVMLLAGVLLARPFLISGNSYYNKITATNKWRFMFLVIIFPYLAGSLLIFIVHQPSTMIYETVSMLTMVIALVPLIGYLSSMENIYFDEEKRVIRPSWIWIGVLAVMLVFYRLVLINGLRFNV